MSKNGKNLLKLTMAVSLIGTVGFGISTLAMENVLPYKSYEDKFTSKILPTRRYDLEYDEKGNKKVTILESVTEAAPYFRVMKQRTIDLNSSVVSKIKEPNKEVANETKRSLIATFENMILEYYCDKRGRYEEQKEQKEQEEQKEQKKCYVLEDFKDLDLEFDEFIEKLNENKDEYSKINKEKLLEFLVSKYVNDVDSFVEVEKAKKDKEAKEAKGAKKLVCKKDDESVFDLSFIDYGAIGKNQEYRIIFSPQFLAEKYKARDKVNDANYDICNSPESFKNLCFKIQEEENPYSCLIIGPYYDGGSGGHFMIESVKKYSLDNCEYSLGNYINIAKDLVTFKGTDIKGCRQNLYPKSKSKSKRLKLEDGKEYVLTAYAGGNFNDETDELELKDEVYSEKVKARSLNLDDWLEFDTLNCENKVKHSKDFDVILWFEYYVNSFKELQ